jgi:hypothetical protein
LLYLPELSDDGDNRVDGIALDGVVGDAVGPHESARGAAMDDHDSFAAAVLDLYRPHQTSASCGAIAGFDVDVLGPQASRAVVAVAPVGQRHDRAAVLTYEALILGVPADGSASGSKK